MTSNQLTGLASASFLFFLFLSPPAFALNGVCIFQVTGNLQLNFGALDPSSGATATSPVIAATLGSDQVGDCKSLTMTVNARAGSILELTNGSGGVIPYTLTTFTAAAPGNNKYVQLVLQGTILPANYQNAPGGTYTQTNVPLDVNP